MLLTVQAFTWLAATNDINPLTNIKKPYQLTSKLPSKW